MDEESQRRMERLDAVAGVLHGDGRGLALLALGSGADTARLDRWSDLDFFVVVRPGAKPAFLDHLWWLESAHPVAWAYRNTADGWKALFADGILAEFAVFEPGELARIPFAPGRIVWQADGFDGALCTPAPRFLPGPGTPDWLLGEALSALLTGMARWRRGERLAGVRAVQGHALDAVLRLLSQEEPAADGVAADPFAPERRFEARHPALAAEVSAFVTGIEGCPAAARAMLEMLHRRRGVPDPVHRAILDLCG